ncbi:menaquinone reductase molybdopterin-binding-like subunit QrcB [Halodesulfovibrio sp.]|jgi:anaerobic selenocysteine-containing dehydrogenase|uniref:menaquinone reductase molybdopterin-binding-like subunit QrcB n=1 Tax=Halodesulfovibrio sp. TaxID=1912772 RepID=UPI0025DC04A8|nr:menaquinone reductase molybdopterin-binding-like subunit QrcB [Halodesulfovibrio sp.]MCT4536001.1 molybdopterin-dependent oxidoreductase [Halodesulfovibrio sp.]
MAVDRRGFLKFVAGATTGVLATPVPWKLLDDASIWTQNWSWIPRNVDGENSYISTISKLCPSAAGMKIRLVGNRPVRALPDDNHPLSMGGITALAAAEVQLMYSPSRVKRPLKHSGDGAYVAISWEEAEKMLKENLRRAGSKVAYVSGDETGTINELLSGIAKASGSEDFYMMPSEVQPAALAFANMNGKGQLGYDIENSDYVFAIGANILESWGTVLRNRAAFKNTHPAGEKPTATFVYAGPVQSNTAAGADEWLPAKSGAEAIVAMGIANLLIKSGATIDAPDFAEFKELAALYTPQKVATLAGVAPAKLKAIAAALSKAQSPVVLTGSEFGQGTGVATVLAGTAVNMLLGSFGREGGVNALPLAPKVIASGMDRSEIAQKDLVAYLSRLNAGKVSAPKAMVFYEANPVYGLPQPAAMSKVMHKVPFKVAFTSFLDETAKACDLILPTPLGLERFDDVETPYGIGQAFYGLARPVAPCAVDGKPAADVLLGVAGQLNMDLGFATFEEVLQAKAEAAGADWDSLMEGEFFTSDAVVEQSGLRLCAGIIGKALASAPKAGKLSIAPVQKLNIGTPNTAIPPYNNKTIRRWELQKNEMYVAMNGATARELGVVKHDRIKLSNSSGSIQARVNIFEGVMPNTIAVLMGFGHTAFDKFSKGKGENVMELLTVGYEAGTGQSVWNVAGVNVSKA